MSLFDNYSLIGIGDFSHGCNNTWTFRFGLLQKMINITNKNITIYIEDTKEHTDNIMHDTNLFIDDHYGLNEDGFPYGPLWKYSIRSWDSPIYLEIIKYIRSNKRINIVGIDVDYQVGRDKHMARYVLKHLDINHINFLWMANAHVDVRQIHEKYEDPNDEFRCGYYLKNKLKDKYFIILTTGYKGTIRFNSICNNKQCDERTWPKIPFFENFRYDKYKKYVSENPFNIYDDKQFTDNILEFTDAKFPNDPFIVKSNTWNLMVFFNRVHKLDLLDKY